MAGIKTLFSLLILSTAYSASAIPLAEALYERRCGACHSPDHNRVGPKHRTTWGSRAGSVEGYRYSDALRHSDIIWDEATLDAWLANPQALIAGQKMGYRLQNSEERALIIQYLKSLNAPK